MQLIYNLSYRLFILISFLCLSIVVFASCSGNTPFGHQHTFEGNVCQSCGEIKYSQGLSYSLNADGTCYITSIGKCVDSEIYIPEYIDGHKVVGSGDDALAYCTDVVGIYIPKSVTSIGNRAFVSCVSLVTLDIPDSVTTIGNGVFEGCTKLTGVTIPDGITSIGNSMFAGCTNLTNFIIPDSVMSIGKYSFMNCKSLISIVIPDNITSIDHSAFLGCASLTNITIPGKVASIGETAFAECNKLENISVDENNPAYKSVNGVLYNKDCTTLIQYPIGKSETSFEIPDSVINIGNYAFLECPLENIIISGNVEVIGKHAFLHSTSLTKLVMSCDVKIIDFAAFYNCTSLENVTLPDSIEYLGDLSFNNCTSLSVINFQGTISRWNDIAKEALWNNTGNYTVYCTDGNITK